MRQLLSDGLKGHLLHALGITYEFWSDDLIGMGENWKKEINDAMDASDAALLLISSYFVESPFINETEFAEFLRRRAAGNFLILPILARAYDFKNFEELSSLNFFKPYFSEFGFTDVAKKDQLMPFDVLAEGVDVSTQQLNLYYKLLADKIDGSIHAALR